MDFAASARSVFDWSELMDSTSAWAGREWFVVRKAEVRLSEVRAEGVPDFPGGLKNGEPGVRQTPIPSMMKVVCLPM